MIIEFQGGEVFQKGQYYRNSERFLYIYNSSQLQHPGKRRMRETPQNGKMNRKELAKEMSRRHSMTTEEAKRILELVQTITEEAMERGEDFPDSAFSVSPTGRPERHTILTTENRCRFPEGRALCSNRHRDSRRRSKLQDTYLTEDLTS